MPISTKRLTESVLGNMISVILTIRGKNLFWENDKSNI